MTAGLLLLSCGLEEYYYLPQVPQASIITRLNTEATINLPSISGFYYASNYSIFYRIYISNYPTESSDNSQFSSISPNLINDYNAIFPSTDPTNTSASTSVNTNFRNRNYFELCFEDEDIGSLLPSRGGTLSIRFPTQDGNYPVVSLGSFNNNEEIRICRSSELISPQPRLPTGQPDLFFRNTSGLSSNENAVATVNADVSGRSGIQGHAYVSMYIVAVGYDNALFTQIYSKPTHIGVFKLPNM
ncbi:MAG: hypothetical protein LBH16_12190 [Treponema sp.]|nr:hypothetical protein [Treponema sp.]